MPTAPTPSTSPVGSSPTPCCWTSPCPGWTAWRPCPWCWSAPRAPASSCSAGSTRSRSRCGPSSSAPRRTSPRPRRSRTSSTSWWASRRRAAAGRPAEPASPSRQPRRSDEADADDGAGPLEDQVERFQSVFDDAAIGMATMTLQGRIVRANNALCRILGRRSEELLGIAYGAAVEDEPGAGGRDDGHRGQGRGRGDPRAPAGGRRLPAHHADRGARPCRPAAVSLRAVPGRDPTADRRAGAETQRAAVPSHGRRRPRVRHLHAGHRGARHQLERRRGARQGLDRRRGDRQALPPLLSTASSRRPGTRSTSSTSRRGTGSTRRRGGGSARTAAGSGPSSPSPRSPTRTATTSASPR